MYWPGIDNDIENIILACKKCQDTLPSNNKEPIISKPKPTRPFQEIAADLCSYGGQDYLVLVDCHTDWPDIIPVGHNTTASHIIKIIRQSFCRTGVPDALWSDQGPQFTSKLFQDFTKRWGFQHRTSSPRYPQSNGKIEATVKSMKKLIKTSWNASSLDEENLTRALLQYRNTPSRRDGLSPAQKLFGRPIQDTLPAHRRAFSSEWQRSIEEAEKLTDEHQEEVEHYYNQHAHSLPEIHIGSNVAIQNGDTKCWDIYGKVTHIGPYRRYYVKTSSGRVLVRNRRFLRRRVPLSIPDHNIIQNEPPRQSVGDTEQSQSVPRRPNRQRRRTKRLIEDMKSFSLRVE